MTSNVASQFSTTQLRPKKGLETLRTYNGGIVRVTGTMNVVIWLADNVEIKTEVAVVAASSYPLVIGVDVLERLRAKIDFGSGKLELPGASLELMRFAEAQSRAKVAVERDESLAVTNSDAEYEPESSDSGWHAAEEPQVVLAVGNDDKADVQKAT